MRIHRLLCRLMLLAALTPCVLPATTHAAAIYDGFGYPPGGEALAGKNGGTGWGSPWSDTCCAGSTQTTASGLSFGALAVTPGAATTPAGPTPPPETISIHSRAFGTSFGADGTTLFSASCCSPMRIPGSMAGSTSAAGRATFSSANRDSSRAPAPRWRTTAWKVAA